VSINGFDSENRLQSREIKEHILIMPELVRGLGLTAPFDEFSYAMAQVTPLPASTPDEVAFLTGRAISKEEEAQEAVEIRSEHIQVADGLRLLEETIDLGIPDVITQV
jgi:hypothetical protein